MKELGDNKFYDPHCQKVSSVSDSERSEPPHIEVTREFSLRDTAFENYLVVDSVLKSLPCI